MHRKGIDACRKIVLENLRREGVPTDGLETAPYEEAGVPYPDRPLTEEDPIGTDGKATVRAIIPKGELMFDDFKRDVGFQIRMDMNSFYAIPTRLSFSAAYGLDEFFIAQYPFGKEWRFYFAMAFGFLDN